MRIFSASRLRVGAISFVCLLCCVGQAAEQGPGRAEFCQMSIARPLSKKELQRELEKEVEVAVAATCEKSCTSTMLAQAVTAGLEKGLRKYRMPLKRARGYAILGGTMVASAAATAHLTGILPEHLKFLSQMVAQVSTLGIFVVGAPIWEPMTSAFRKFAFDIQDSRRDLATGATTGATSSAISDDSFNEHLQVIWRNTQGKYSLNTQMSRNVVHGFILAAQVNFHQARVAMESGDKQLAVMQIAEAAVRMRRLFAEIPADDESVRLVVHASFALHTAEPEALKEPVLRQIEAFDPAALSPDVRAHYVALLSSWLTLRQENINSRD